LTLLVILAATGCVRDLPRGPDLGPCAEPPDRGGYTYANIGIGTCLAAPNALDVLEKDGKRWLVVANPDSYLSFSSGSLLLVDIDTIDFGRERNLVSDLDAHALPTDPFNGGLGIVPGGDRLLLPSRWSPESATRVGHPAPFPVALPERLIHLHTYVGDLVLDPFMGSGSTAVAAVRTGRHYIGYDTDRAYVEAAEVRLEREVAAAAGAVDDPAAPVAVRLDPGSGRDTDPVRGGWAAKDYAKWCLAEAGFTEIVDDAAVTTGVQPSLRCRAAEGTTWWIEVAGGRTGSRPGLLRLETLWKAIAKGAVVASVEPASRYAVLAWGLPSSASGGRALDSVTGVGRPVAAVIDLSTPACVDALRALA
jgi:hypothetical protein